MSNSGSKTDPEVRPTEDRRQILLHLEAELIKDLKKAAVDLDTSASAIANDAVDQWLRGRDLRKSRGGE